MVLPGYGMYERAIALRLPAGGRILLLPHSVQTSCRTNPTTALHLTAVERSRCTVTPAIGAVEIFGKLLGQAWRSIALAREDTWSWYIRINCRHEKKFYDASRTKLLLYRKIARERGKRHVLSYKRHNCAQPMLGVVLNFGPLDSFIMPQPAFNINTSSNNRIKIHFVISFFFPLKLSKRKIICFLVEFSWIIRYVVLARPTSEKFVMMKLYVV
jgi:hypothetical protein